MNQNEMLDYYRQQSVVTDPKSYAGLYDAIPDDVPAIAEAVQGLIFHYMADKYFTGYEYPKDVMQEIDTRYVEKMLKILVEKDDRPLTEPRPYENRLVGCCRDFATLFTSIMRHKGIPCRVRYGFATYLIPDFYADHVIAEYWDGDRWVMTDPQMGSRHIEAMNITIDVQDVTREAFPLGGNAWQLIRNQQADPHKFGVTPEMAYPRGTVYVVLHILQDIASLNRQETLCWDGWGYANMEEADYDEDVLHRLDALAELSLKSDVDSCVALQEVYKSDAMITVPNPLTSYSPALEQTIQVELAQ